MEAFVLLLVVWVVLIPIGVTSMLLAYPALVRRRSAHHAAPLAPVVPLRRTSAAQHVA